jgi:hypothetical protein
MTGIRASVVPGALATSLPPININKRPSSRRVDASRRDPIWQTVNRLMWSLDVLRTMMNNSTSTAFLADEKYRDIQNLFHVRLWIKFPKYNSFLFDRVTKMQLKHRVVN